MGRVQWMKKWESAMCFGFHSTIWFVRLLQRVAPWNSSASAALLNQTIHNFLTGNRNSLFIHTLQGFDRVCNIRLNYGFVVFVYRNSVLNVIGSWNLVAAFNMSEKRIGDILQAQKEAIILPPMIPSREEEERSSQIINILGFYWIMS